MVHYAFRAPSDAPPPHNVQICKHVSLDAIQRALDGARKGSETAVWVLVGASIGVVVAAMVISMVLSRAACTCGKCEAHVPQRCTLAETLAAWLVHPATTLALALLVSTLISAELQRALVKRVKRMLDSAPTLPKMEVESAMRHDSAVFANATNAAIRDAEQSLNSALFGWVNTTIPTANAAMNSVLDAITGTVGDILRNTPLDRPVEGFVGCVVGSKISVLERALGWMQIHIRITLPLVSEDVLLLPFKSTELLPRRALSTLEEHSLYAEAQSALENRYYSLRRREYVAAACFGAYIAVLIVGALWYKLARQRG